MILCGGRQPLLGGSSDRVARDAVIRFWAAIARGSARSAAGCGMMGGMTAQPVGDYDRG